MTFEHVFDVLAPYILPPLIFGVVAWVGAALSGLTKRAGAWLDAHQQVAASRVLGEAATRLQAAMQNEAGQMAFEAEQGHLNFKDVTAVAERLKKGVAEVTRKVPGPIATLQPADGAIVGGIRGKITSALPVPDPASSPAITAPIASLPQDGSFQARAAIVVSRLMRDLSLERFQAAGIVGNAGQESGLRAIQEIRPVSGRGGFGWFQWTGPRRLAFEAWCKANGMSVTDDEANYQFLIYELQTTENAALAALRQTTTLEDATRVFEEKYERAGVVMLARRQTFAEQALAA